MEVKMSNEQQSPQPEFVPTWNLCSLQPYSKQEASGSREPEYVSTWNLVVILCGMALTVGFFCLVGYSKGQMQPAAAAVAHPGPAVTLEEQLAVQMKQAAAAHLGAPVPTASPKPAAHAPKPQAQHVSADTNQVIRETNQALEKELSSGRYSGGPPSQEDQDQLQEAVGRAVKVPYVGEVLRLQPWHPERYWVSDAVNDQFAWVAIDKPSYDAAAEASSAGYAEYEESDRQHLRQLYREGKVFRVPTGAKLRVLAWRQTDQEMKIKLLSGTNKGRTGWIDISFVGLP
jgi:hypothetical protein